MTKPSFETLSTVVGAYFADETDFNATVIECPGCVDRVIIRQDHYEGMVTRLSELERAGAPEADADPEEDAMLRAMLSAPDDTDAPSER